jgi:AraC family transcriptional regulator of adaptative response/methylated-DNA-[protein]-cysteine methyltransferase
MMMTGESNPTEADRWAAVCARDASADGRFVLAVRTTGVYCRPSCAARQPLRANVEFFAAGADARAAGYRACKRCVPEGPSRQAELVALVDRACRTIETAEAVPTLAELAAEAGKSVFYFQRVFTRIVGVSPREYAAAKRADGLRDALPANVRIVDAVFAAGFGSSSRAYAVAAQTLGMAPAVFRAGGHGERVRYAAAATALGWIAVAATARGVAAIELGETREAATNRIVARFAAADVAEDAASLHDVLLKVLAYVDRPSAGLDLPLDVQGTAFARRVWRALTQIPPGHTATYAQVATAIGRPGAARAVASACAANPAALAIPCHRVVPAAGGSGGYRWGAARKRSLLDAESR